MVDAAAARGPLGLRLNEAGSARSARRRFGVRRRHRPRRRRLRAEERGQEQRQRSQADARGAKGNAGLILFICSCPGYGGGFGKDSSIRSKESATSELLVLAGDSSAQELLEGFP